jgi:mono/diheme cytochrome c family protein
MGYLKSVGLLTALMFVVAAVAVAEEKDPLKPRVPADQMADAKAMKNPTPEGEATVAKGKALFEGKGTCFNCHGKTGEGNGPAGAILNPSPRNFTNCKFHKKRKDGELFWVIKNGSPGTGMVSLTPGTITEEEAWTIIRYERTFCKKKADDE